MVSRLLERWGHIMGKARWWVVAAWIVLAAVFGGLYAGKLGALLTGGGWAVPDSGSYKAYETISQKFASRGATSLTFVVKDHQPDAGPETFAERLRALRETLLREEAVAGVDSWLDTPEPLKDTFIGGNGNVTFGFVEMRVDEGFAQKELPHIQERLSKAAKALGLEAAILGAPAMWAEVNKASREGLANAHLYAIPVILVVLFLVFRSVASSLVPLVLAAFSVAVALGILYFFAERTEQSVFVLDAVTMLGIGLGIDFALLFVSRFREELARDPRDIAGAVAKTTGTAGHAILFSSLTIMGSMAALLTVEIAAVRSMALGVIVTAFVLLLLGLSLLPALAAILGTKVNVWKIPLGKRSSPSGRWYRLSHHVMKRPILFLAGSALLLAALAWPALQLKTSAPDVRMLPEGSPVRRGVETMQEAFGLGVVSPVQIVLEGKPGAWLEPEGQALLASLAGRLKNLDGVDTVVSYLTYFPGMDASGVRVALSDRQDLLDPALRKLVGRYISADHGAAVLEVISHQHASSEGMKALVREIRDAVLPAETGLASYGVYVGGQTAEGMDVSDSLRDSLVPVILLALGLIFTVLLATFRSLILPLKAILLNLLSLGATYGVLVIVFQWGLGKDLFGFGEFGYIQNFIPILLLGLLFSLSTDYEVFLLTRVKEEYNGGKSNEESVALGLEKTAPMISGAAVIMVAVFASFAFAGILPMQQLGLGMAAAIALDATVVRLLLVPAAMKLLGYWNWWFPGGGGRAVPPAGGDRFSG